MAARNSKILVLGALGASFLSLASVAALGAGCSGGAGSDGRAGGNLEPIGHSSEAVTVCAAGATVEGIDVSEFQGSINWGSVKASGRGFAIARVSDGTGHSDPTFSANWSGIKAAGMVRGVYQFFRASEDPTAQANLLVNAVGTLGSDDLPPVADVEVLDGQSGATLVANLATWVSVIKSKTGRTPMIYSAPGFWDPLPSTSQFGGEVLWVANWQVNCPDTPTPWSAWKFWQYADNGTVPGISGLVDLDRFNGATIPGGIGGSVDWAAAYVSQSFPLASTALTMTEGQTIPSYIELKNVGAKTWDSSTHLGTTQPRDRASAFADSSWLQPDRPAGVTGTVAPGGTFKFLFNLHAPSKAGTYFEYFGVVEDGVAWFSDPGQGGPPDNDLEVQVVVVAPEYRADFSAQSFPLAPAALPMRPGDVVDGWIELTNSGTKPWVAGTTKLAPTPRDVASPFADSSWLSPTRVSTVMADVPPGQTARFPVTLTAPAVGDYQVTFGVVEEAVSWFSDAPLGGGPADDFLRVHVTVLPAGEVLDAGAAPADGDGGALPPGESGGLVNHEGSGGGGLSGKGSSGCSIGPNTGGRDTSMVMPLVLVGLALVRRGRRRGRIISAR